MKYDVLEKVLHELYKTLSDSEFSELTSCQLKMIKNLPNDISSKEVINFINSTFFHDELGTRVLSSTKNLSEFEVSSLVSHDIHSLKNANISIFSGSTPDLKKDRYYYVASGILNNEYLKKDNYLSSKDEKDIIDKLYESNDKNYYKVQLVSLPLAYTPSELDKIINTSFTKEEFGLIMNSFNQLYHIDINLTRKYVKTLIDDIIANNSKKASLSVDYSLSANRIEKEQWQIISRRQRAMEAIMSCSTIPEIKETAFATLNNGIYRSRAWDYIVSAPNETRKRNFRNLAVINKYRNNKIVLDYYSILTEKEQEEFVDKFFKDQFAHNDFLAQEYRNRIEENTDILEKEVNNFFKGPVSKEKVKKLIKSFKSKPYNDDRTTR